MKKTVFKIIIFSILFFIIYFFISNIFVRKGTYYGTDVISFYKEPKNSLDLIFFGSSHSYSTFSPKILKEETGLESYNFATQQQPIWITYHYMKEALKYQKPKYFVVEILMLSVNEDYAKESVNRDAIDNMRMSKNKIETIMASVEKHSDRISYYINLIKYHSRWNELTNNDIAAYNFNNKSDRKGFTYLKGKVDNATKRNVNNITKQVEISAKNEKYLRKIIELCKKNNIKLILVKTPYTIDDLSQMYYNYVEKIAKDNNIYYLNYNLIYNDIEMDFENDFYDAGHLNGQAAERVTRHFSKYLNSITN